MWKVAVERDLAATATMEALLRSIGSGSVPPGEKQSGFCSERLDELMGSLNRKNKKIHTVATTKIIFRRYK